MKMGVAASLSLLMAVCIGCDSKPYELAPVSGRITFDGEPLGGGVINLQPIAGENKTVGPGSTARCDADGRFTLKTLHDDDGAVVGEHRVRVYSFSAETAPVTESDEGQPVEKIPHKYNYRSTLTFAVPSGGTDEANFDLNTE